MSIVIEEFVWLSGGSSSLESTLTSSLVQDILSHLVDVLPFGNHSSCQVSSQSLRLLLPMQEFLTKIIEHVDVPPAFRSIESTIKAMVFEDNNSALLLATSQLLLKMMRKCNLK